MSPQKYHGGQKGRKHAHRDNHPVCAETRPACLYVIHIDRSPRPAALRAIDP